MQVCDDFLHLQVPEMGLRFQEGGSFRMSETTNQSPTQFLAERQELRGAYSNLILPYDAALKQYKGKAKSTWSDSKQVHGADYPMWKWIEESKLIRPELFQGAHEMLTTLDQNGYRFERDISLVRDAVNRFAAPHAPNRFWDPHYQEMLKSVNEQLKPTYWLMSIDFESVADLREFLSNPKASAGVLACYSVISKKKDVTTKKMLDLLYELERQSVQKGTMNEPTIIGIRLQSSIPLDDYGEIKFKVDENGHSSLDFKLKTRLVNMVSLPRIMAELHYSVRVQAVFGSYQWYAGGKTPNELFHIMCSNRMRFKKWDSLDYSAYDQSLPGWFIHDAFNIIKGWFNFKSEYDSKRWDVMVRDFIHKGLVSDEFGNITRVHDGVESGSMFTQIIDTLCNYMMMAYFCILKGKKLGKDCVCNICGDDNTVFHDGWFNGADYLNTIRKVFGVIGNASKSALNRSCSEDPEYLSRTWKWSGIYRYWKELLIKLVFHERYREYTEQVTPQLIFKAFIECYPLGMDEGFDLKRFYSLYPDCSTIGSMSEEAAKAVGGIIAYETIYGGKVKY